MVKGYYGKYEHTGKIFSGRKASSSSRAYSELQNLNKALLRAGLEPVRAEGRSTKAYQEAQEKARVALEEEERRKEKERLRKEAERLREEAEQRKREEEEERADRARRFAKYKDLAGLITGLSALYSVLTPEEAADLRKYDSDDQETIGAMYLGDSGFGSIDEAAKAYYAQQQSAFDDMAAGDYDADFSGVPFF